MYIIDENRNTLLGREWIRQLSLDIWNVGIHNVHTANTNDKVRILLEKYCKVFEKSIGKVEGIHARLQIK